MNKEQKCDYEEDKKHEQNNEHDCEKNRKHEASESCKCDNEISVNH